MSKKLPVAGDERDSDFKDVDAEATCTLCRTP
jgi:hypothetical protein